MRGLCLAAVIGLCGVSAGAADWPHFLGPAYDNSCPEKGLRHEWPKEGLMKVWESPKGVGHSAPAVSGGKVVVFYGEGTNEVVQALDAAKGTQLWRFSYPAPFKPKFGGGSGPCTNPTIAGGRVYTLGISGKLHCLDLATGEVVWKRELATDYDLLPTFFGQGGTPLVLGERVIVPLGTRDQKSLVAFDAATGKELWATKHPWNSSYSSPIPATLHGRECVLAFQGGMEDPPTGGLLIIDAKTGAVLSATPHRAKMFASVSISAPVVAGTRVFVAEAYTEGGLCVDVAPDFSTKPAWRAPKFDTYMVTALAHQGALYGFAGQQQQNAELVCHDLTTGKELWRDDLGGKFQRASLIRADGAFLCLGENGDLAWLELTPKGGAIKAQTKLFHAPETWAAPVISDGRLYICQNEAGDGGTKARIICYDLRAK
jgi:outer membrane protein assembly factor BamB